MTTLAEFYATGKGTYEALRDDARENFIEASENLAAARASYDALMDGYTALEKQIWKKRQTLVAALMPADIEELAEELRDLLDQSRHAGADLLDGEKQVAQLKNDMTLAADQLKRAKENLKKATEKHLSAVKSQKRHDSWKATVDDGTLADLAADADALLDVLDTGGTVDPEDPLAREKTIAATVRARINADIPEKLLTRALERARDLASYDEGCAGLLENLEDEAGTYRQSVEGTAGKVEKLRVEFLRAEEAYGECVLPGRSRYDQAMALLAAITESPALTDAEKVRITDTDLVSDGEAALVFEKARDDARAAVDAKKFELELAIAGARAADISADPEDDTDVQAARAELTTLNATLTSAEAAYTSEMRDSLDLWEASIPDHIWANVVSCYQATTLLTSIRDGDPAALATAMDDAESALVEALEEQEIALLTNDYLKDSITVLGERIAFGKNSRQRRLISAIRGDE